MIHRKDGHFPFRLLADRRDGMLPANVAAEADRHLAEGCAQCTADAAAIDGIVAGIREGDLPPPPRAADRRVAAMFADSLPPADLDPDVFVAALVFDQAMDFAPALRAAGTADRRMLFAAGSVEIDLAVTRDGGLFRISGEVVHRDGAPCGGGEVQARRGRRKLAGARIRDDGRFELHRLPPGRVSLRGVPGRSTIGTKFVLPYVELGL